MTIVLEIIKFFRRKGKHVAIYDAFGALDKTRPEFIEIVKKYPKNAEMAVDGIITHIKNFVRRKNTSE